HVRFPVSLRGREDEVRAWVETLWRPLTEHLGESTGLRLPPPSIDVSFDPAVEDGKIMVGYEHVAPPSRPAAGPVRLAKHWGRGAWALRIVGTILVVALVGLGSLFVMRPETRPKNLTWPFGVPSLPQGAMPSLNLGKSTYVTRIELYVRREPRVGSEIVGAIPRGETVRFAPPNIVEGDPVNGEARWVDMTPLVGYFSGKHMYIWYGGLEPSS
ncbi:MAG: hypothetical protein ACYC1C_09345, partial [Chloroflexota bacterium]